LQQTNGCHAVTHLLCFALTLNIIVQQAVQAIIDLKTKVKNIVTYFRQSTVAAAQLEELQERTDETKPRI